MAVATASGSEPSAAVEVRPGIATAPGAQEALSALIPFYIYPSFLGSEWDTVTADPSNVGVIVANPASGPGASSNSDYVTAIAAAQAAGLRVVGYVDTNYTARPLGDVQADIDSWVSFYGPDGIFLDRTSSLLADSSYYWDLRAYVDSVLPPGHRTLVLNHGTSPVEEYASIGDVLITFENDASAYPAASFASWMDAWPREKFSHILYNDPDWRASLALARSRPVGFFFSTDDVLDNPWDSLPSEWSAQQAALGATIGGPTATASLTAGAAAGASVSPGVGTTVPQGVVASDAAAPAGAASLALGAAAGIGVQVASASSPTLGTGATASVGPAATASASLGAAAAVGGAPGSSSTASAGVTIATAANVSAAASVATGTATAVGFTPAVFVSATPLPGVATASGVAPSSSTAAPIVMGLAALTGVSAGATGTLGSGGAVAATVVLSAAASISTGSVVTVGFVPTDDQLDTMPIPGIATATGAGPSSTTVASVVPGQVGTSGAVSGRATISPAVAQTAGAAQAAAPATPGTAIGAGLVLRGATATSPGVVAFSGSSPAGAAALVLGAAAGIGTFPVPVIFAPLPAGAATVVGFPPESHLHAGAVTATFTPRTGATLVLSTSGAATLATGTAGVSVTLGRDETGSATIEDPDGASLEVV
jgi:hypothetical protein